MKIVLVIHLFPSELGGYDRTIKLLMRNHVPPHSSVIIYSVLNCSDSIIDWYQSSLTKSHCIEQFNSINNSIDSRFTLDSRIVCESKFLGVNDHRRNAYRKFHNLDYIFFLDCDIVFSSTILQNYINLLSSKKLSSYSVVTPQTLKLWDSTWDIIVHPNFREKKFNSYKKENIEIINKNLLGAEKKIISCETFKFAGGWFTMFSPKLLNYVKIPRTFGGYGPDDTFIMSCMFFMKRHNMDVNQYILENEIINEIPIVDEGVIFKQTTQSQRNIGMQNFHNELLNFSKKL